MVRRDRSKKRAELKFATASAANAKENGQMGGIWIIVRDSGAHCVRFPGRLENRYRARVVGQHQGDSGYLCLASVRLPPDLYRSSESSMPERPNTRLILTHDYLNKASVRSLDLSPMPTIALAEMRKRAKAIAIFLLLSATAAAVASMNARIH